jgi:hypothetical protein
VVEQLLSPPILALMITVLLFLRNLFAAWQTCEEARKKVTPPPAATVAQSLRE